MAEKRFYSVVTDAGAVRMTDAVANGRKVAVTEFAVGDGSGSYYSPKTDMMQLKNELWRGNIDSCEISSESENVLVVKAIIPGTVGGFTVREMGIFDTENLMVAVCNTPDTPKVKIIDGVVNELCLTMEIALINGEAVELLIDPNIVTATKKDVEKVWEYLRKTGKVIVGKRDTQLNDNDVCLVVDEMPYTEEAMETKVGIWTQDGRNIDVTTANGHEIGIINEEDEV